MNTPKITKVDQAKSIPEESYTDLMYHRLLIVISETSMKYIKC